MRQNLFVQQLNEYYYCDTGSPHIVIILNEGLEIYPVAYEGSRIRYDPYWAKFGSTNVNFAQKINYNTYQLRTYERGVENETLSCGTGAVATALVATYLDKIISPIKLITKGGELIVHFEKISNEYFENIHLIGEAKHVFSGCIEI